MWIVAAGALSIVAACGSTDPGVSAGTASGATVPDGSSPIPPTDAVTTAEPASTAPASSAPASSAAATSAPGPIGSTELALVVATDALLGWWDGTRWVDSDATSAAELPSVDGAAFTVVGLGPAPSQTVAGAPVVGCEPLGSYTVAFDPPFDDLAGPVIAVNSSWDLSPRPTELLDAASEPQVSQLVAGWLSDQNIAGAPVGIVQIVRSDLDGDGTAELLIAVEHPDATTTVGPRARWYSAVLLVRTASGGDQVSTLASDVRLVDDDSYPSMTTYRLQAVVDLNGDGRMEIAVHDQEFEGAGTTVFELPPDGTAHEVLTGGCGV